MKYLFIVITFVSFNSFGQLESISGQFWNNYTFINPSMAGVDFKHQAGLNFYDQWSSLANNPSNLLAYYNTRIKENHGLGMEFYRSFAGNEQISNISIPYSFQLATDKAQRWAFGLAPGFRQIAIDSNWVVPQDSLDPALISGIQSQLQSDFGLSFTGEGLRAGISVRNVRLVELKDIGFTTTPTFYGHLGYKFRVNRKFDLIAESMMAYTDGFSTVLFDARMLFWEKLTVVAGFRARSNYMIGFGWDLKKKFRGMYTYGFTHSKLNNGVGGGSHEATLVYKLDHKK